MESLTELGSILPESLIKVLAAIICGGIIGYERERKGKPAGLRTNILICLGATMYMIISEYIAIKHVTQFSDPGRVAAQVVVGIGFIGAGTIIQARGTVAGLTTAATIWVVAAIGLVIGAGFPIMALIFTLIVLLMLAPIRFIGKFLLGKCEFIDIDITFPPDEKIKSQLLSVLNDHDVEQQHIELSEKDNMMRMKLSYCHKHPSHYRFLPELWTIEGLTALRKSSQE
jgi:putative Mg2+ transporter-C (MgtC) family protein